jgi:hypothetical protein
MPRLVPWQNDLHPLGGLKELERTPLEAVRNWRSRFPTAGQVSNTVALAALTGTFEYDTKADAIRDGFIEGLADSYFRPNGIFLRMRLICFGVENRGDLFRTPQDTAWWRAKYKFGANLWDVLETYAKVYTATVQRREDPDNRIPNPWFFDADLLKGDQGEIAQAHLAVVRDDLPHFQASKCEPPYFIPTFGGLTPLRNPKCDVKGVVDAVASLFGIPWWMWVLLGMAVTRDKRR